MFKIDLHRLKSLSMKFDETQYELETTVASLRALQENEIMDAWEGKSAEAFQEWFTTFLSDTEAYIQLLKNTVPSFNLIYEESVGAIESTDRMTSSFGDENYSTNLEEAKIMYDEENFNVHLKEYRHFQSVYERESERTSSVYNESFDLGDSFISEEILSLKNVLDETKDSYSEYISNAEDYQRRIENVREAIEVLFSVESREYIGKNVSFSEVHHDNLKKIEFINSLPENIREVITLKDIEMTDDGFFMCTKSLADILEAIGEGSDDSQLYYDDWYLYAIEDGDGFVYSILKMREQEYDGGDGDDPGVMIPFISLDPNELFAFNDPRFFGSEVDRVVRLKGQTHDPVLQQYFSKPESTAGYLIADLYVDKIISYYPDGVITNESIKSLKKTIDKFEEYVGNTSFPEDEKASLEAYIERMKRVPNALLKINEDAGYEIYNPETEAVTVKDVNNLTHYEKQAILAIHTSNVNYNSFVAEIVFHADACVSLENYVPYFGKNNWYESGIRADMALGEEAESGVYDRYYDLNSKIVKEQVKVHGEK